MNHPTEPESNPTVAHEETDANAHAITQFGIALVFVVILSQLVLWWLFGSLAQRENKLSPPVTALIKAQAPTEPPEPRLQGNPQADMRAMRETEDAILNHYAWVDPDHGVVRLPIQRALDLVAQRGLPQFKSTATNAAGAKSGVSNRGDNSAGKTSGARPQTPK